MKDCLAALIYFISAVSWSTAAAVSFIHPCLASDPNLNQCIENVIRSDGQRFADGIPEIGVTPLDPLKLDVITLDSPSLKLVFSNTSVVGLRDFKLNYYKVSLSKGKAILDFTANVTLKGDYSMNGQILILPIQGQGDAKIKITNLNINLRYDFKTKDGFWVVTDHTSTHKMERAQFKFSNLFNGNKHLGDSTNKFLNDNWDSIMQELAPPAILQVIQKCIGEVTKLFSAVPVKELMKP